MLQQAEKNEALEKKTQEFHRFQFWLLLLLYQCWCGGIAWWVTPFRTSFRRILQWYLALKQQAPMDVVVKQLWLVECDLNENSQNIQRFVLLMNVTLLSIMFPQLCTLQPLVSCLLLQVEVKHNYQNTPLISCELGWMQVIGPCFSWIYSNCSCHEP